MNTKALRQKVLNLAIHGKLVPQNPADESAEKLLEKIRAEKAEKIKKGELKANKKDSFIFVGSDKRHYEQFADGTVKDIEDEIPFEVPYGWAWCRLSMLVSELGDGIHGTPNYNDEGKYYFVNGNNLINGKIEIKPDTKKVDESEYLKYKKVLSQNTVFVSINGTLGNVAFYNDEPIILGKSACFFNLLITELKHYCYYFLISDYFKKYAEENATGSTIKNVSLQTMRSLLLPLPPLEQQERIIVEIEKSFKEIDFLEQNKFDLQTTIKQAKSKILDLAIHGRLVQQNSNDEPAEELLKRIATSDNRPYKKLDEDDGPFEIPKTWTWCRIKEIAKSELGKTLDAKKNKGELYNYLCALNVKWFSFDFSTIKQIRLEEKEKERYLIRKGDLLICEGGDVGRAAIWESDKIIYYQNALHRVRFYENINQYFYLYVLNYYKTLGFIDDVSSGVTIKHFTQNSMNKLYFPLPPIKEQYRIVSKIEELFLQLDTISDQLA